MRDKDRLQESYYLEWAKTRAAAPFNLAASGVENYPTQELPITLAEIELNGVNFYGYPPLQAAVAAKCGVDLECVVAAAGASMANHLAMAAVIRPGDEVLIERPTYDPLLVVAVS